MEAAVLVLFVALVGACAVGWRRPEDQECSECPHCRAARHTRLARQKRVSQDYAHSIGLDCKDAACERCGVDRKPPQE